MFSKLNLKYSISILVLFFLTLKNEVLYSQDFHLSQYWSAPMNINPALTGLFNQNLRFTLNYRSQWLQTQTYNTYLASVETNIGRKKFEGNFIGLGLNFFQEIENNGSFSNTALNLSAAYLINFKKRKINHGLSLGFTFSYLSKQINLKNAVFGSFFENQINEDPIIFNNYNRKNIFDVALGANYLISIKEKIKLSLGISASHIANPDISFTNFGEDTLYRKINSNISADFKLAKTKFSLIPMLLIQFQGPFSEINIGTYTRFTINDRKNIASYLGVQYRLVSGFEKWNSDAIIFGFRQEYKALDFGLSYDFTLSNLRKNKSFIGSPEIYLSYAFSFKNQKYSQMSQCPKF